MSEERSQHAAGAAGCLAHPLLLDAPALLYAAALLDGAYLTYPRTAIAEPSLGPVPVGMRAFVPG